jgi:8-oxo-dGTP diphosphatase
VLHVVAAILWDAAGRVLVNERPAGKSMAGYWEFPGGKLEPGESEAECVTRELREELGVAVRAQHALCSLTHQYAERFVLLGVHVIDHYVGQATGIEGQQLRWASLAELDQLQLLPADLPIIETLRRAALRPSNISTQTVT